MTSENKVLALPFLEKVRQEPITTTVESRLGASAGVGGYVETLTHTRNRIAAVYVVEPLLVRVERGTKVLRTPDRVERFGPGALVVVNAGVSVDVENLPDGPTGKAVCTCLMFAPELVRKARAELGTRNPTSAEAFKRLRDDGWLSSAVSHAVAGFRAGDAMAASLLRHRMCEVLMAIEQQGYLFRVAPSTTTSEAVRNIVSPAPHHDWTAREAARQLHMSEPTLRRYLAREGTSFRRLLLEARMSQALAMLQGSRIPILEVAAACGYASASRFATQFQKRFGLLPSAIRD